jgi:serine/threonine-protein kinase HipA
MAVQGNDRRARIATALAAAGEFGLRQDEAIALARQQIETIRARFRPLAEAAGLTRPEADLLAGRAILNPYAFEDAPQELAALDGPL